MHQVLAQILTVLILLATPIAEAGQVCNTRVPAPEAMHKGLALALTTREKLDQTEAKLVLIGRVGSDLSEHGLRYSHAGLVWRDNPKGRWMVTHLLNHCGSVTSALFDEGLGNFFLDDPFAYEAIVVVPSPTLQEKLVDMLASRLPVTLHTPNYSMIAHPFSTRYQNSNQWLLELVAASIARKEITSRADAQRWLQDSGYIPSRVRISPLKRLGASLFSANVRFDDHDAREEERGLYQIVSVESVIDLLSRLDPGTRRFVIALD